MSIRRTLWSLPAISTVIFAVGLSVSAWLTTQALAAIEATGTVNYPVLETTSALITDVRSTSSLLKSAIAEGERERIGQADQQAAKVRDWLKRLDAVPGQRELAQRLTKGFEDFYVPAKAGTLWMMGAAAADEKTSVAKAEAALKALEADLAKSNDAARTQFADGIARSEASVRQVLNSTVIAALVVVLSLVAISHFVVRSVWGRLGGEPEYAHAIATAVASGDLSMDIQVREGDDKSLLAAIHRMKQRLEGMIGEIKTSGTTIKTASAEISAGSADLASRTELQAGSLQRVAAAMEEMTGTVKRNVDHAVNANKMTLAASDVAVRGGEAVNQVVATMDNINKSAQKIADIINVIDGIAFQTNILALNAAVEAARAGEQGRGFAVVAAEVRSLAQRSATAAKEIEALIRESVGKVGAGTKIVNQAGATMTEIVASVKGVAEIMGSIAKASQEQSAGIDDIRGAIDQMDGMTQQNAAMVEEASAAAMSLQEQASSLARTLEGFRLSVEAEVTAAPDRMRLTYRQAA